MQEINYSQLKKIKESTIKWINSIYKKPNMDYIIIISYGNKNKRCKVYSLKEENTYNIEKKISKILETIFIKNKSLLNFFKVDLVNYVQEIETKELLKQISNQKHNNHFRKGISLDKNLEICFLEQEIYGKSIIKGIKYNEKNFLDENNLNNAIREKYPNIKKNFSIEKIKKFWIFETTGIFFEYGDLIKLQSGNCENGVRFIQGESKNHIKKIIYKNASFLHDQILDNGKFIYGYFPAFDNKIKSYNTVRHCTSIYALIESFEIESNTTYWPKINLAIQYALDNFLIEVDENLAHMIDSPFENTEIKLGSNAAAILMLCKYQEITNNNKYQEYAEKIANGIIAMIDKNGDTTHVLDYPSLKIKEKFRIVYYDGEAALALLRLYKINKNELLLNTVKLMFNNFIFKSYEKYHDHWLSYCTNELTEICPTEEYYIFGIKNYLNHMDFIKNRKTAYATFLEMMMSAYKMVERLKLQGHQELLQLSKLEDLKNLINQRVEFQRTGFFYPEVAMYMEKPDQILNSFYVRHDRFRTRIDDQEHNLSGYIAYYLHFGV